MKDELCKKRFEHHLRECNDCRKDVFEYTEIIQSLTSEPATAEDTSAELLAPASVIPFPKLMASVRPLRRRYYVARRRAMAFSLSATIFAMTIAILAHTGHLHHVANMGDVAWDHVSSVSHSVLKHSVHFTKRLHL